MFFHLHVIKHLQNVENGHVIIFPLVKQPGSREEMKSDVFVRGSRRPTQQKVLMSQQRSLNTGSDSQGQ